MLISVGESFIFHFFQMLPILMTFTVFFATSLPLVLPEDSFNISEVKLVFNKIFGTGVLVSSGVALVGYLVSLSLFTISALLVVTLTFLVVLLWDNVMQVIPHKVSLSTFLSLLFLFFIHSTLNLSHSSQVGTGEGINVLFGTTLVLFVVELVVLMLTFIIIALVRAGELLGSGDAMLFLALTPLSLIFAPFTGLAIFFVASTLQACVALFALFTSNLRKEHKHRSLKFEEEVRFIPMANSIAAATLIVIAAGMIMPS